jgi:hypothetical protein
MTKKYSYDEAYRLLKSAVASSYGFPANFEIPI